MNDLKRCPCGEIPDDLIITEQMSPMNWSWVAGNCCGEWNIEFRSDYESGEKLKELAVTAWNSAPRGRTDCNENQ